MTDIFVLLQKLILKQEVNPLTNVYVVTGNTVAANHDLNLRQ